jgi:hypothetical protein
VGDQRRSEKNSPNPILVNCLGFSDKPKGNSGVVIDKLRIETTQETGIF